ncbi:hypothetical protein CLIB1423_05S06348 [[Candida] railenensis]|uniref:Globin domain-containing protein n=1 Tax=[Candida] railenensis TaxID=45579 RepID=A0A9P0VX64_9ASCO|nr:hypothetical protein CLIB1423_05S06348 [[Candida] railenensis]
MSTLTLQDDDLFMVRYSWSNLQLKNKDGQNRFMNKLFANMIIANPKLHSLFNTEEVVREQAKLFGEMVSFTMAYLDDTPVLHDCMSQFVKENPSIINLGINYIEPLGISLIQTFHQTLGKGKFSPQLEGLWVKVYLYLANSLLQSSNDSDSQSLISVESEEEVVTSEDDRNPYDNFNTENMSYGKVNKDSGSKNNLNFGPVKVKFQLSSNEKYKGFRRSVNEAPDTELEASIPANAVPKNKYSVSNIIAPQPTFSKAPLTPVSSSSPPPSVNSANFDPRKIRRNSKQPSRDDYETLPAKNPRRMNSTASSISDQPPRRMSFDRKELPTPPSETIDMLSSAVEDFSSSSEEVESEEEPVILAPVINSLPKDPRRLQFKREIPANLGDSESDEELKAPEKPFDPRRLRRRPTSQSPAFTPEESEAEQEQQQDAESVYSGTAPLFSSKSASSTTVGRKQAPRVVSSTAPMVVSYPLRRQVFTEEEDDDDSSLMNELLQITTQSQNNGQAPSRSVSRENPYAKGLAPIREADFDDDTSSKYDSDNENSDHSSSTYERSGSQDEVSSGVSTLSLHNSDYRSSISSGNSSPNFSPIENSKSFQQQQQQHTHRARQLSQSSEISYMKPLDIPEPRTTYVKNQTSYRVSAGFMRSSFVLQNMAQKQSNSTQAPVQRAAPAPVVVAAPKQVSAPRAPSSRVPSIPIPASIEEEIEEETTQEKDTGIQSRVESDSDSDDDCLDLINSFVPVPTKKQTKATKPYVTQPRSHPQLQKSRTKSSPQLQQAPVKSVNTNSPIVLACDKGEKRSLRERLGFSRSGSKPSSRANSFTSASFTMSHNTMSTSDLVSVASNDSAESTFSGFSFFSSQPSDGNRNRRASMDTRRRSIDVRVPKIPGAAKYNKIKAGKFQMFGAAI